MSLGLEKWLCYLQETYQNWEAAGNCSRWDTGKIQEPPAKIRYRSIRSKWIYLPFIYIATYICMYYTSLWITFILPIHLQDSCLGFFTPVKTLPSSKSCPHLRLHTYSEKPEQLTNCLCLRRITAKILSYHCHSTCCARQHWHISRETCKIHAILTCGWLWTLSVPFLCIRYRYIEIYIYICSF